MKTAFKVGLVSVTENTYIFNYQSISLKTKPFTDGTKVKSKKLGEQKWL